MKVFVLMISKQFMKSHPRAGQLTHFADKIQFGLQANAGFFIETSRRYGKTEIFEGGKITTIRPNYERWKMISDKVNSGEAILSLRQWSGKPYRSKQVEILQLREMGAQRIDKLWTTGSSYLCRDGTRQYDIRIHCIYGKGIRMDYNQISSLYKNDGLAKMDFINWFDGEQRDMAIIHFTSFRY